MSDDEIELEELERLLREEGYSDAVREILSRITPREAKVLRDRLNIDITNGASIEDVTDQFEVTRQRIKEIEQKALCKLSKQKEKARVPKCSFCGKKETEVKKLIKSATKPGIYICDGCVEISTNIIDDD